MLRQIVDVVDTEVKAGTAHPISPDLPTLIRTLAGTTALTLTGDPLLVGRDNPPRTSSDECACSNRSGSTRCGWLGTAGIVTAMTQTAAGRYYAGKRCFVTGAASGIGRATALRLAAQRCRAF